MEAERLVGAVGAEAEAVEVEPRPVVLRQRRPVAVDGAEDRPARLQPRSRARPGATAGSTGRNIAPRRSRCRRRAGTRAASVAGRVHPAGAGRGRHDQHRAVEGADRGSARRAPAPRAPRGRRRSSGRRRPGSAASPSRPRKPAISACVGPEATNSRPARPSSSQRTSECGAAGAPSGRSAARRTAARSARRAAAKEWSAPQEEPRISTPLTISRKSDRRDGDADDARDPHRARSGRRRRWASAEDRPEEPRDQHAARRRPRPRSRPPRAAGALSTGGMSIRSADRVLPVGRAPERSRARSPPRQRHRRPGHRCGAIALARAGQLADSARAPPSSTPSAVADGEADAGEHALQREAARDQRRRQRGGEADRARGSARPPRTTARAPHAAGQPAAATAGAGRDRGAVRAGID